MERVPEANQELQEASETQLMKILVLYKYYNHYHLLQDMMDDMGNRGLNIAALDVVSFKYHGNYCPSKSKIKLISQVLRIPRLRGLLLWLFRNAWIALLAKDFDLIDIHAFSSSYGHLMEKLEEQGNKLMVTYWGSDLFRASNDELEKHKALFKRVEVIRTTSPAACDKVCGWGLPLDIAMCRFGVGNLLMLQQLRERSNQDLRSDLEFLPIQSMEDKLTVIVGNNGNTAQQHLKIFSELKTLDRELFDKLFFILPVSYGLSLDYRKDLVEAIKAITSDYLLIDNFLEREKLNALICQSDIYITAQKSDAFSAYVQEHLAAGTIVLSGEWLPYFILRDKDIYIEDFNFSNFKEKIGYVVENFTSCQELAINKNRKMFQLSSWDNLGTCWHNSYLKTHNRV